MASRFLLSPLLLVAVLLIATSPAALAAPPSSADFIRRSCAATLYPKLCYSSLKPYSTIVKHSPLSLAVAAANVSLPNIQNASFQAAALLRRRAGRIAAALYDCADVLRTAGDLTRRSAAEIQKLKPGEPSFYGGASDAQTWLSAALNDEDTCIDGVKEAGGATAAAVNAFVGKVGRAEHCTSNALALLNALVHG